MRILSVSEFSKYCNDVSPVCYIYATDNQSDKYSHTMKMTLRFSKVIINLKPDRICFMNELDKLFFECVKEVHMFDDKPSIGTVFSIICMDGGNEVAYTFIAD